MSDVSSSDPIPMSRRRRWLVYALTGGLILGHAYDVVTHADHWPISSYPMYAYLNPSDFRLTRLFGVTDEPVPREIPIDSAWLRSTFARLMRRPDAKLRVSHAVTNYARSYGWDRRKDYRATFVAYRLYEHHWTLKPDADPERTPDRIDLLFEVHRDGAPPATAPTTTAPTTTAPTTTAPTTTAPTTMLPTTTIMAPATSPATAATSGEASRDAAR